MSEKYNAYEEPNFERELAEESNKRWAAKREELLLKDGGMNPSDKDAIDSGSYGGHSRMWMQEVHNMKAVQKAFPHYSKEDHAAAARFCRAFYDEDPDNMGHAFHQSEAHLLLSRKDESTRITGGTAYENK